MKTRITSALLLAAALCASALSVAAKDIAPVVYPVSKVTLQNGQIETGSTQMTVLRLLGSNPQRLSSDIWVYRYFTANQERVDQEGCDALVVTCTKGKVTNLQLVNDRAVASIAANLKLNPSSKYAASGK